MSYFAPIFDIYFFWFGSFFVCLFVCHFKNVISLSSVSHWFCWKVSCQFIVAHLKVNNIPPIPSGSFKTLSWSSVSSSFIVMNLRVVFFVIIWLNRILIFFIYGLLLFFVWCISFEKLLASNITSGSFLLSFSSGNTIRLDLFSVSFMFLTFSVFYSFVSPSFPLNILFCPYCHSLTLSSAVLICC